MCIRDRDEIVKNIKNTKDKTITEEQMLKVEEKYRAGYLEPARKALEGNMKALLDTFTRRILGALDTAGLVKTETKDGKAGLNIDLSR